MRSICKRKSKSIVVVEDSFQPPPTLGRESFVLTNVLRLGLTGLSVCLLDAALEEQDLGTAIKHKVVCFIATL